MANLLINTTVGGNAVITTSNIGSYALTSLPSHNHDDRYYTEGESDGRYAYKAGAAGQDFSVDKLSSYYLRNHYSVSTNHSYGMYFDNDLSSAYGIYRESGSWDHPYPDLRIAFHTGIKLGANSGYQGIKFYTDYDMVTQVMSVNNGSDPLGAGNVYVNNSLQAGSSLRAPIFYDSNDTSYYLDPNGNSVLTTATFNVNASSIITLTSAGTNASMIKAGAGDELYIGGNNTWQMRFNGANVLMDNGGYLQNNESLRAPIFYDSDDGAYYGDFASTSRFKRLLVQTASANGVDGPALRVSKAWDNGTPNIAYDTVVIESNDVTTIRMKEADGTTAGWTAGDGYTTYTSTSPMRFYTAGSAGSTVYNGMGGTLALFIDSSQKIGIGTATPTSRLHVVSSTSGSDVLAVDGVNGRLFTVTDDLSDSLFSVNTIAGLPVIEAFADNTVKIGKYGSNSITISGSKIAINSDTVDANFPFFVGDRSIAGARYSLTNKGMGFNLADNYAQLQLYGGAGAYIDFTTSSGQDSAGRIMWDGNFNISGTTYFANNIYTYTLYDRNDTAYYLDMNGTSRLGTLNINQLSVYGNTYLGDGNGDEVHINDILRVGATDSGDAHFYFGEGGSAGSDYGSHWYWDSGYTFTWNTRNNGTDTALFDYVTNDTTYVNWRRHFNMQSNFVNYTGQLHFSGGTRFVAVDSHYLNFKTDATDYGSIQVRDGNNTLKGYLGYYDGNGFGLLNSSGSWGVRLNPGNAETVLYYAGNWRVQTISGGVGVQGNLYTDNDYGYGLVGLYSSYRYQGVFAMGDSYKLAADGTGTGSLYGIAWTHTNVGGQSKSGLGHQALFMAAGATQTAIGTGIWTNGLITSIGYGTSANWNTAFGWGNHASAGYLTSLPSHNHDDRYYTETESDNRYVQYGSLSSSFGLNDNKLYLRTNNDNNHYIWNAADDWEEIVAYSGTGLRIASSTGVTLATFTTGGNSLNITGNAATATALTSMNISQFTNNSGYTSNAGTVTSVSGTGTVSGLTLSGTVTTSGSLTLGGTLSLTAANVNAVGAITNSTSGNAATATYATTAGSAPNGSNINSNYDVTAGVGNGLRFWNGSSAYKISMGVGALYQYGPVTDYSIKAQMNDGDATRGFTWGRESYAPIAALNSTSGDMEVAGYYKSYGYRSNSNVGGVGSASWHPDGIYCGSTMWQYGSLNKNNTGIYNVSEMTMYSGPILSTYNTRNLIVRALDNNYDVGILGQKSGGGFAFQIYGEGSNYGFLGNTWGSWDLRKTVNGVMYMNNDTTYYLHTNSTSNFYALNIQGNAVVHAGNIGSQSISYAATSGSAGSVTGLTLTSSANGINPDNVTQNQIGYNGSVSLFGQTDGGLYSSAYNSNWIHQIYGDFRTGQIAIRGKLNGTWQAWRNVLDSSNYTSYAPSLTGSGASGTWGINISGNAATATNVAYSGLTGTVPTWNQNTTGTASNITAYTINQSVGTGNSPTFAGLANTGGWYSYNDDDRNPDSGNHSPTISARSFRFSFVGAGSVGGTGNYAGLLQFNPWDGTSASTGDSSYQLAFLNETGLNASGVPGLSLRNGINSTWNAWYRIITSGNIASQSVSYASTAGSSTIAQQLTKFGDIYGQDWNSYFITGKLIVSNALGHSGSNRPSDSYGYGTALSYGETGGPLMQMYFPEDVANSGGAYRALAYRSGYNGSWSAWKTVVNQVGNTCTVAGSNGTGLQVHSNVGYNQNPLTYFLLRGQADSSWKTFKILLTGDAGGQDIEFRRIAENATDARMFYVPRGLNQVIFDYTVVQPSDSRLKDNLTLITTPVDKIKSLRGVEFDWNSGEHVGTHDVGLIAQDVEAVLPEAVTTQEDGYKNLAYTKVIPLLVEAMKEQQATIDNLLARIKTLENN